MDIYTMENIAQQKINALKEEAANERLVHGQVVEGSYAFQRTYKFAVALLALIGWVVQ